MNWKKCDKCGTSRKWPNTCSPTTSIAIRQSGERSSWRMPVRPTASVAVRGKLNRQSRAQSRPRPPKSRKGACQPATIATSSASGTATIAASE